MKSWVLLSLVMCLPLWSSDEALTSNPLVVPENTLMAFDQMQPAHITASAETGLQKMQQAMLAIYAVEANARTFENTIRAFDNASSDFDSAFSVVYLMNNVSPSAPLRAACEAALERLESYNNGLLMDLKLFNAFETYAQTNEAKQLSGFKKRFLDEKLTSFRNNGLALPLEQRNKLEGLRNELSTLSRDFERNIADDADFLLLDEAGMAGLDDDYKQQHRNADGQYKVDLSYPSYRPFMRYATSATAREALYRKYQNRATSANLPILSRVLLLRKQLATLLGFSSYADYQLSTKLAGNSRRILDFEEGLIQKLKPKAEKEYALLLAAKQADWPAATAINNWDISYYREKVMIQQYQVDQRELSQYFEIGKVREGLFRITQSLMGVSFHEVKDAKAWHPDVTLYEVREGSRRVGYFYLDLFPRANKYGHAACFSMTNGKGSRDNYRQPIATLVCNFPQPIDGVPALMSLNQVETFFHEFGHVLHQVLTEAELHSQSGTTVYGDFVEAPSQIFENWVWNYDALKMFARHHKTDQVFPKALFDRMLASENAFSGTNTLRQVFLGMIDLSYHHDYDPAGSETTDQVVDRINLLTTVFPPVKDTHFQASFGHLMGYGANYYGYLFSKVFSADMFSAFEKEGVLNAETGKRYRKEILAKGGTDDPMALMRAFLGREPGDEAFSRSLGIQQ